MNVPAPSDRIPTSSGHGVGTSRSSRRHSRVRGARRQRLSDHPHERDGGGASGFGGRRGRPVGRRAALPAALARTELDAPNGHIRLDENRQAVAPITSSGSRTGLNLTMRTHKTVPGVEQTFNGYFRPDGPPGPGDHRVQEGQPAALDAAMTVGTQIAGYRLEELVGRGGMGVVYRAHDVALERSVALKLLSPSLAEDRDFRERFLVGSRLAAALEHPASFRSTTRARQTGSSTWPCATWRARISSDCCRTTVRSSPPARSRSAPKSRSARRSTRPRPRAPGRQAVQRLARSQ